MAIHGPHTTAPELIREILDAAGKRNLPISIHLAESDDEIEFITTGKGQWADFLSFRGIKYSHWGIPAKSPVQYLEKLGGLNENMLAVHLLQINDKDADILSKRKVKTCLCPRSNKNLHGRLPDIAGFFHAGLRPCLGTDSLASCDSLSIFDEMAFTAMHFESISPADIFGMGTINGALALGLSHRLGTLHPEKESAMVYVPVDCSCSDQVLEKIVNREFQKQVKRISGEKIEEPSI
jgi:cytosine/adenosine deaminase-related metal-dependent hydrolase